MRTHLALGLMVLTGLRASVRAESPTPTDLVARHVVSLGSPQPQEKAKARVIEGPCLVTFVRGGAGNLAGRTRLASDGSSYRITFGFDAANYRGEIVSFSQGKVEIGFGAFAQPGRRSDLGNFLNSYDAIVREGLLGGVLSTAWPLLDLAARQPKLKSAGLKNVEKQKWLKLSYRMQRNQGDMDVDLYFEPETFRHRRTVYALVVPAPMGAEITSSSQQKDSSFHLEESFADFKEFDGLTLPTTWSLTFGTEFGNRSSLWKWETEVQRVQAGVGDKRP